MIPYGEGEYLNERETPLCDWFHGKNLANKLEITLASDGDLFGGRNPMLAIRHLRQRRVIHVPLNEAIASGLPQWFIPRELRVREKHVHRCWRCGTVEHCRNLKCFGDADRSFTCNVCDAAERLEACERMLRQEQERTPNLWESSDNITRRIFKLKSSATRAKRRLEDLTANANV